MHRLHTLLLLALVSVTTAGCELLGDVLEFGFWTIVVLIGVIVLLVWLLRRVMRRDRTGRTPPSAP